MLLTELKKFPFSRYPIFKFQKYKGFYNGKFELQMLISPNQCLRLMEHDEAIFGQVGDLYVYFRRKVPDF